jgi:RNA polymerase sigma factor (sigma-70 family)
VLPLAPLSDHRRVGAHETNAGAAAAHLLPCGPNLRASSTVPREADVSLLMPNTSKIFKLTGLAGAEAARDHRQFDATEAARAERDGALAALLQQACAGSTSAFEAFYDQTFGYAQALARRMLGRRAELDDVLSSAYFQVWRELSRFDAQRGSAVTWLLTIVRSRALDTLRLARSDPDPAFLDEAAAIPSDEPAPDELLQSAQTGSRLHAALATLNAQERWVLALAYFREMSHGQVASVTGLPLGTVKSLILRAQGKLRNKLTGEAHRDQRNAS